MGLVFLKSGVDILVLLWMINIHSVLGSLELILDFGMVLIIYFVCTGGRCLGTAQNGCFALGMDVKFAWLNWYRGAHFRFWYNTSDVYIALTSGATVYTQGCGQSCTVLDNIATYIHWGRGAFINFGMSSIL